MKNNYSHLKIGIVCYPSIGGSGIVATNLGLELAKLGHEVHFISYEEPFLLNHRPARVFFHKVNINEYALFKYPDYTLPLAETIVMVHARYKLNVLHVHYAVPHATAALLAKRIMIADGKQPPKIITTLHGTDITLLAHDPNLFTVIKFSIERSDGVTAVSQNLKEETVKTLDTKKDIKVIYNFYNPVPVTQSRKKVRQNLSSSKSLFGTGKVSEADFLAIHLSNLRPVKRIPDLLKITAKLKDKPRFKLLILAGNSFKPYIPLVNKLRIQSKIIVRESVKNIQNFLNGADLGIYTSETESFGMGMLETMAYGKPVLATKAGGVPEVATNGHSGYLLPVGDVAGFANKIKLLMDNPKLASSLGQQAKERAAKNFGPSSIAKQYLDYYCKNCGGT
jgi:L-malate glycosyltransferase